MMRGGLLLTITGAALALSACQTTGGTGGSSAAVPRGTPVQVTRFHLGQPIAPGDVSIEPKVPDANSALEFQTYEAAIAPHLTRLGFTVMPSLNKSELVLVAGVNRGTRDLAGQPRSPVTVGLGGSSYGGGGVGLGVGTSFGIGKKRSNTIVGTELQVQLKRRSDGTVIWEGRASTEARLGTPGSDPGPAVTRLAQVLFADFPGESGRTITVK
jgi:hypothetical protein